MLNQNLLKKHAFYLLLLPILIWACLFLIRPYTYSSWCAIEPTPCLKAAINSVDQFAFNYGDIRSDFYSNILQNTVGVIAFLFPALLYAIRRDREQAAQNLALIAATTAWNGALLETARLMVQRPRPMVFNSPMIEGLNVHQYTSFYSGHTSFVALATVSIFFMVRQSFSNRFLYQGFAIVAAVIATAATGALRVHGGRHFPSDVIFGALAGLWIAVILQRVLPRVIRPIFRSKP